MDRVFVFFFWPFFLFAMVQAEKGPADDSNYYSIYESIDTMTKLTPYRTFYELLGVDPGADDATVSRAFRKTTVLYHPDKLKHQGRLDERTEKLSKLVQFIGSLLRTEKGRRDYDWILNEAPAWHRQTVYVMRKWMPSSKLTLRQVGIIVIAFSIGVQLLMQWCSYLVAWYMILSSRWEMRGLGEKEIKRMRKRIVGADPSFIAMNNSAYHMIMLADSNGPPLPSPLDLWIFKLPIRLLKSVFCSRTSVPATKSS